MIWYMCRRGQMSLLRCCKALCCSSRLCVSPMQHRVSTLTCLCICGACVDRYTLKWERQGEKVIWWTDCVYVCKCVCVCFWACASLQYLPPSSSCTSSSFPLEITKRISVTAGTIGDQLQLNELSFYSSTETKLHVTTYQYERLLISIIYITVCLNTVRSHQWLLCEYYHLMNADL